MLFYMHDSSQLITVFDAYQSLHHSSVLLPNELIVTVTLIIQSHVVLINY